MTLAVPVMLAALARYTQSARFVRAVALAIAGLLVANWLGAVYYQYATGNFELVHLLPMELCDWAAFAVMIALPFRRQGLYEVAYFWGLSGTLQAVFTPNILVKFPDYRFIAFFALHSGVIAGVLFMTLAMGFRPRWGSLLRAIGWSQVYIATAMIVNHFFGTNFGFLGHKPKVASLLDLLSNNKVFYVMDIELLGLAFFLVLYAPYAIRDWTSKERKLTTDFTDGHG